MNEEDGDIERLLRRYRPRGPAAGLLDRTLAACVARTTVRIWPVWVFRAAVAAVLLLALGLNHEAGGMSEATAAQVGIGPVVWTEEAEDAARLVGGGEAGREYIAICLIASTGRDAGQGSL